MSRPIHDSAIAAPLLELLAIAFGASGRSSLAMVAQLLAVYFAADCVMLLAYSLFANRAWRLTPTPQWSGR